MMVQTMMGIVGILTPGQSIVSEFGTGGDEANSIARGRWWHATQHGLFCCSGTNSGTANGGSADTAAPASVTISPADDATDVLTIANLQIFFTKTL